jgi:Mycobacterium membrane protein
VTGRALNAKGDRVSRLSVGSLVRRGWTVIVTVFVVAIVAFSIYRLHRIFGSNNAVTRPSADALETPATTRRAS